LLVQRGVERYVPGAQRKDSLTFIEGPQSAISQPGNWQSTRRSRAASMKWESTERGLDSIELRSSMCRYRCAAPASPGAQDLQS
jgi:hypothetical protein